ncbi:MAG: ABC transporter ATP-binding protein [Solirubrobacterales bacterium]
MTSVLQVESLTVNYGSVRALRGVSLEVKEGQMATVIGPNGAGKSTLLWTICGVLSPEGGRIALRGDSVVGLTPEAIVGKGIAIVPEGRHVLPSLTVGENLQLARTVGRKRGAGEDLLDRTLQRFPVLSDRLSSPAGQLSGGEAQQLAIARALLMKPDILLLDEPSFGLAPLLVEGVFEELSSLREDGMTILVVEQNAGEALEVADTAYILSGGEVETSGDAQQILEETDLTTAYFGKEGA